MVFLLKDTNRKERGKDNMSLIAHYKLDGNALDSSGNGNHGTASNVSWVDGKIGQCGNFNGSSSFISIQPMEVTSVSLWINFNLVTTISYFLGYSSSRGIRYDGAKFLVYDGTNGWTLVPWTKVDAFVNFTVVIRGAECDIYIDGVKIGVANKVNPLPFLSVERIGNRGDSYYFPGHIDDVRFYDHALSEKEVKELSKAKILHYDFDDFQEPTENLCGGNPNMSGGGYGLTYTFVNIEDGWRRYSISGTGADTTYPYSFNINPSNILLSQRTSFSWKYKTNVENKFTNWGSFYMVNISYASGAKSTNKIIGDYRKCTYENVSPASGSEVQNQLIYFSSNPIANMTFNPLTDFVYFKDVQAERKSYSTPFTSSTRAGSVSDKSGYDNHAELELATTPQWTEDSKIGSGAYKFNGTNSLTTNQLFFDNINQEWTASGWCKLENNTVAQIFNNFNSGNRIIHSSLKALLYANSGVNDHYVYSVSSMPLGEWFHIAFVYRTSDQTCKIYLNGKLDASSYNYSSSDLPSGFSSSTIFGQGVIGLMDDVRIYATALSADDIKELYQTRASIDNKGNLFCGGINECSNWDKPIINESGIYSINTFNEVGLPIRYIRDSMVGSSANTSNHWVEIQAFNSRDNNIALGKTAVSSILTDGNTNSSPYYSVGPATVDLGDIYTIMYLKIWHYWADARTYHKIKTEVSADNINWITVFDSDKDGEYVETSEGKEIILYPNKASIRETGEVFVREINEV